MRRGLLASALLLVLLAACAPNRAPRLHDVYLFGLEDARLSYVYGLPGTLVLEGGGVALTEGVPSGAYSVADALLVDGAPFARTDIDDIEAPARVERIPLTTDVVVRTSSAVALLVYFDGFAWYSLATDAAAGLDIRVVPRRRIGRLQGIGALSPAEADAVAEVLEARGRPVAVAQLDPETLPERTLDGLSEYLRTGLYLQSDVPIDADAYRAPAEEVVWEVLSRGSQAVGIEGPRYEMVVDRAGLLEFWNRVNADALNPPPLPDVDFSRETVVVAFLGPRTTGGFRAEVLGVEEEGGELFVDLVERGPSGDAVVTQALTNPWIALRVLRAGYGVTWFRDPESGQLYAAARAVE